MKDLHVEQDVVPERRLPYFDFCRGVGIIMVVAIHSIWICYSYPGIGLPAIVVRNVMNAAVPLFLAVSGFFLAGKRMENGGYARFLKKRLARVYIPVLFCSLEYLRRDLARGGGWTALAKYFSCGYGVYYFVALVIQCYLLLWFFQRKMSKPLLAALFVAGCSWWALYTYVVGVCLGKTLPLVVYGGNVVPFGLFFVLGMVAKNKPDWIQSIPCRTLFLGAMVFGALSVAESMFVMDLTSSLNGLGQKATSFCLNAVICILALRKETHSFCSGFEGTRFYRFLCLLGRYSFGIYLIHSFVLEHVPGARIPVPLPSIRWAVCTVGVILVCLVPLVVGKRMFPRASRVLLGV